MKTFGGSVLFLDRADINTDEIIPAKYLTENTKEALRPHLLEDLELDGFHPGGICRKGRHRHEGEFRLRVVARTRRMGPGGQRDLSGHRAEFCAHLPTTCSTAA